MGANLNVIIMENTSGNSSCYDQMISDWNELIDESLYEHGHSYSGRIGMLGHGITSFVDGTRSYDDAYRLIMLKHKKWEPALAVEYQDSGRSMWLIGGWCSS